jgi:hypothetical protein
MGMFITIDKDPAEASAFQNFMFPSHDPDATKLLFLQAVTEVIQLGRSSLGSVCAFFTKAIGFFFCEFHNAIELQYPLVRKPHK